MLAKVAYRRSSWLRSLMASQYLSCPLHNHVNACIREDKNEEEEEEETARKRLQVDGKRSSLLDQSKSLNCHLQWPSNIITTLEDVEKTRRVIEQSIGQQRVEEKQVKLQADTDAGKFLSLITSSGIPATKDVVKAKTSLQKLARDLADPRAAVVRESSYQRARRQLKAATGKLDRMLYAMRQQQDFGQVEAVAFLWEEEFPQFAGQRKHWSVICEHYALALNYQQRFQDVVDKFSDCYQGSVDCTQSAQGVSLLTPRLAQSIFVALGHLRDAARTLQLLRTMECHDIHVTKVSYFHVLNALLHDERFTDFEKVMQICENIVTKLPGEIVPLSLLPMIMMTAAACGKSERALKFYSHPPDMPMSTFTEFRFEICLQQLIHLGDDVMLMEMYRNLMVSVQASLDLKERVSKYLLRKRVEHVTATTRNERLSTACEILEIMNQHKIRASYRVIYSLLRALLIDPLRSSDDDGDDGDQHDEQVYIRVGCAKDLHDFFSRYSHSLEWNTFALCEAIVAGVRSDRADLVDDLFVHALGSGMPIKYAALEQVVVYYYRLGLINDLERVSDMVHALRLNKHISLGIAVTEVAMAANLRLHRYDEVVILFEDFSSLDGERRRVLQRQFMLKTVLEAYTCLGRSDEAMAIQALLHQVHGTLLDESENTEADEAKAETRLDAESTDKNKLIDDSNCDQAREQERFSLHRFKS
ncbi:unnamed protein product [Peronospora belbahrii]|uniref:Pentacotripeptide-repeat region of PRORP domain-containing protein n=1 Tax=Peronospora belbahrii TaxID=622444 RepID=A0AAU9L584_9STRA|nr:unnamed protein product [Peronospora belbahrii]CAH0522028.1 unnamed protein product [Peronospora belbahrii]